MTIKTKLVIGILLFIVAISSFASGIFVINQRRSEAEQKRKVADELVLAVFERNLFLNDFLAFKTERATQQLLGRNDDIGEHLAEAVVLFTNQDDILELRHIEENHTLITTEIQRLIENKELDTESELYKRVSSQIFLRSQSTASIAKGLVDKHNDEIFRLHGIGNSLFFIFLIVSLFLSTGSSIVIIGIIRSITGLRQGADIIAKGNTKSRIDIKTEDEIGQLGHSINTLTDYLVGARNLPENILRSMKDSLFVVDTRGKITEVNQAATDILGYKKEELIGQPVSKIFKAKVFEGENLEAQEQKPKVIKYVPEGNG